MVCKHKEILDVFFSTMVMVINSSKSMVTCWEFYKPKKLYTTHIFPFQVTNV
jgi:hypothetical protein